MTVGASVAVSLSSLRQLKNEVGRRTCKRRPVGPHPERWRDRPC